MPATGKCPTCGRSIEWSGQFPFRPFCSERCRLIDLGAWLTEKHVIPGGQTTPEADPPEELPD
ncbi:MAG TPA: DNA gyrase inhibitor YacG [Steroidobacteraceae bacterium]|nr:DNA gyrase inhibitor YacG [Steroidobacteraceae bacterium]